MTRWWPRWQALASTAAEGVPEGLAVQVPLILAVLDALGIAVVGKDGYEADDVIGTLASTAPMPVDVVTGDRDLFQLVDDERPVRVLYIARGVGNHEVVDDSWVQARYGIPAQRTWTTRLCEAMPLTVCPVSLVLETRPQPRCSSPITILREFWRRPAARNPRSAAPCRPSFRRRSTIWRLRRLWSLWSAILILELPSMIFVCPTAPAKPELFAELSELLGLGGSADRIVASLAKDP